MHRESVDAVVTLPATTSDVGELLNLCHKREKKVARDMLRIILSSVRFLARQGLTLRGNNSDAESNLLQLLKLRSEDCPQLHTWLQRERLKYTSHECQNEMLEIMACTVQRRILSKITESPFLALMVDKTTDISNKEQLVFVIRRTDADLNVHEDFLGMHEMKSTDAESITSTIKTVLLRLGIPIAKL